LASLPPKRGTKTIYLQGLYDNIATLSAIYSKNRYWQTKNETTKSLSLIFKFGKPCPQTSEMCVNAI